MTPGVEIEIQFVKGIGPERAKALRAEGIETLKDLLMVLPRRYEDRRAMVPIGQLERGRKAALEGKVIAANVRRARRMPIFEAVVEDATGRIPCVFFGQAYLRDTLKVGRRIILFGAPEWDRFSHRLSLSSPDVEVIDEESAAESAIHMGRVVPVYERRAGITPKQWRRVVTNVVRSLGETKDLSSFDSLPASVREQLGVVSLWDAWREVHDPSPCIDDGTLNAARSPGHLRLILEECFLFSLGLSARRLGAERGPVLAASDEAREAVKKLLPFPLTSAQKRVVQEIAKDFASGSRMNRLLQGDVGAGKTMVAAIAMVLAAKSGAQSVLIAPTEVLSSQHALTLSHLLGKAGITVTHVTGKLRSKERKASLADIATGAVQVAVGTHALLEKDVIFQSLGLVVIDEQHRFGVAQRDALRQRGTHPHMLVMTATPIPRTLALSLYGDLETSFLDEKPAGRAPIATRQCFESQRAYVVERVRRRIEAGEQAFVVCPLVEESEKLVDVRAATELSQQWAGWLAGHTVGLLHGRMSADEKSTVMSDFVAGEIRVLVSTTVIEVGVDVKNATIMVIEQAERFGIAQLHQLRGRVGRGSVPSECLLVTSGRLGDAAKERIDAIVQSQDGFFLAERDLSLRGHGEFFGIKQSGRGLFQIADPVRDRDLLAQARAVADAWWRDSKPDDELREFAEGDGWKRRFGLAQVG